MNLDRFDTQMTQAFDPFEDAREYRCPVCGAVLYAEGDVYVDEAGEVVGCEACVHAESVWRVLGA